ncbi:MAG: hypothetical protein AAF664_09905 [Planctomycetota bacterium]
MRTLLLLVALVALNGCDNATQDAQTSSIQQTISEPKQPTSDDPATYTYHRDVAFTDVTTTMPDGSVDHIDFNMAADPNVVVVVTVVAPRRNALSFTTTFSGDDGTSIERDWTPAKGGDDDDHVGLFVLPAAVNSGRTVIH